MVINNSLYVSILIETIRIRQTHNITNIISSCLICYTVVLLQEPLTPVPAHRGPGPGPVVNSVTTTTGSQSPPSITPIHIHQVSDNSTLSYECDSDFSVN